MLNNKNTILSIKNKTQYVEEKYTTTKKSQHIQF